MQTAQIATAYLMYFVVPLWLLAGLADWACHRATQIETTSGLKESLLHSLMLAEIGVAVLAALFLEINAFALLVMIAALFVHGATAVWDVSYAAPRRRVTPFEQHVHSFLEVLPLLALSLVAVTHWEQMLALSGFGAPPDFSIRLKNPPLPPAYTTGVLAAVALLQVLPFGEELLRCLRIRQRQAALARTRSNIASRRERRVLRAP